MATNRNFKVNQGIQVGSNITVGNTFASNAYLSNKSDVTAPPSLMLDFTKGRLDPRVQCSRTSDATYTSPEGKIVIAGPNTPRLDWSLTTRACLGLFSEEPRTNFVGYSDIEGAIGTPVRGMFSAGAYPYDYPVVSNDVWIGPNKQSAKHTRGTTQPVDDNSGYMGAVTTTVGTTYTASIYVYIPLASTATYVNVQWESGTHTLNPNPVASANVSLKGVWQRIVATCTVTAGSGTITPVLRMGPIGAVCYTDCWQMEVGSYATSWIPTTNVTSATRAEDVNYITPISSFYNHPAGTMYGEIQPYWTGTATAVGTRNILGFDEIQWATNPVYPSIGTAFNGYALYLNPAATTNQFGVRDRYGGSIASQETGSLTSTYIQANTVYKVAATQHPTTYMTIALNGSTLSDSNQVLYRSAFQVNRMYIGYGFTGGAGPYQTCGYVRKIAYYPRVLSAAELAALTET